MTLLVVGGVYRERCIWPDWQRTFGSAGRAASALAALVDDIEVLTPAPHSVAAEYEREAVLDGIRVSGTNGGPAIQFDYVHGMSAPAIFPAPVTLAAGHVLAASSSVVLRFGMLEATARVDADVCVYDPQSAFAPEPFHANGSRARRLAVIANRSEAMAMTGAADAKGAARALLGQGAEAVVIKSGSAGAFGFSAEGNWHVPARLTRSVFPIGSGDVFAAAFTAAWAVRALSPPDAAEFASRCVAEYVETMSLPIAPGLLDAPSDRQAVASTHGHVYLAGPFFSMSQRWLVDEARRCLREMGMEVFSPLHDVGSGSAHEVAPADIEALKRCDRVFALLDGLDSGTLFEVGYARALGKPVFGFAQTSSEEDLKMVVGTDCRVFGDFVTCLHHCAWNAA